MGDVPPRIDKRAGPRPGATLDKGKAAARGPLAKAKETLALPRREGPVHRLAAVTSEEEAANKGEMP